MNNPSVIGIIYFDGVCNLCNSLVRFVLNRGGGGKFKFASLQGIGGSEFLEKHKYIGHEAGKYRTIFLQESGVIYSKSTAILRICRSLYRPWSWTYCLIIVPVFLRDFVYSIISKYRYSLFGKLDACRLPQPHEIDLFLP